MQQVPIILSRPGMVLARDVSRPDSPGGPPLCGKGQELTDGLIVRLKSMGIQTLVVEGHPVLQADEKSLTERLAELDRRFSKVSDRPRMQLIRGIFRECIRQAMKGPNQND